MKCVTLRNKKTKKKIKLCKDTIPNRHRWPKRKNPRTIT